MKYFHYNNSKLNKQKKKKQSYGNITRIIRSDKKFICRI